MTTALRRAVTVLAVAFAVTLTGCGGADSPADPRTAESRPTTLDTTGAARSGATSIEAPQALDRETVRTMSGEWIRIGRRPNQVPTSLPAIPQDTWQPDAEAIPDYGNTLFIEHNGQEFLYSEPGTIIAFSADGGTLTIGNAATLGWEGQLRAIRGFRQWRPGFYASTGSFPLSTMVRASMSWRSTAITCASPTGWIAVDHAVYDGDQLGHIDLRFEQRCPNAGAPVRGKFRWTSPTFNQPLPIPSGLWQAPSGSTPSTGSYVYLQSDAGDYIGQGRNYLYTLSDAALSLTLNDGHLRVDVDGDEWWHGNFQAMSGVMPLRVGYYPMLQRYPFHNPARGGLDWSGDGRGCNQLTGWFAIDSISVSAGAVTAVDLRFEQHCEGWSQALRGKIHWRQDDPATPSGPQFPAPTDLWRPATGSIPATGSFVYLESSPGDWVGGGRTLLFTPQTANLRVSSSGRAVNLQITEGSSWWYGNFGSMELLSQIQPGYYPDAFRYPLNNPTRPGLSWFGDGRGCNESTGWFVVDHIRYEGTLLTAFEARFEQYCDGSTAPLRGHVRWTVN
jgi:hypothetical protein